MQTKQKVKKEEALWFVMIPCRSQEHAEAVRNDLSWPSVIALIEDMEITEMQDMKGMNARYYAEAACWIVCLLIIISMFLAGML